MRRNHALTATALVPHDRFVRSEWAKARNFNRLDFEMAAWLRMHLFEVFRKASNWGELNTKLHVTGFYLKRSGTHLWLWDCHSNVEICTCSFLGFPSMDLEMRLGSVGQ